MRNARNPLVAIVVVALAIMVCGAGVHSHAQSAPSAAEKKLSRLDRLEAWVAAVNQHKPGELDDGVLEINQWSAEVLIGVLIDVATLTSLVREPSVSVFYPPAFVSTRRPPMAISYSGRDLERLRRLATTMGSPTEGRENLLLKRGAMLHADIAMLAPADARVIAKPPSIGSTRYRLHMDDGRPTGMVTEANHWDLGRLLLDRIRYRDPRGGPTRGPAMDETVRLWYIATCAHMISIADLDPSHSVRAVELFPNDPDVLFLRGAMHESMAAARRQAAMRKADVPSGVTFAIGSRSDELSLAERFYKRALESAPHFVEARIHYARVLGERGRHEEAVRELQKAAPVQGELLQYFAALFLGGELEALDKNDEARRAYELAAERFPSAQSPRLALSRLGAGRDRVAARETLLTLAAREPEGDARNDPWWLYDIAAGRGADVALDALHAAIESGR